MWLSHYKKISFSKELLSIYSGRLLLEFGTKIFSLFLPIFLFREYGDIQLVIIYFMVGSLGYVLLAHWGAKVMITIGVKATLIVSVFLRIPYFYAWFNFADNPLFYSALAAISMVLVRSLFWLPFQTEVAEVTDRSTRGKQFGIIFSVSSIIAIISPILGGFILAKSSFAILMMVAMGLSVLAVIPFFMMPKIKESMSWKFIETVKYFFHPFNRRMVWGYMGMGAAQSVQGIFWPIFIFIILDEKYQALGLLTGAIVFASLILRLFIGDMLDRFKKAKLLKLGGWLNATAWVFKTWVGTAWQVFWVSAYYSLAEIVLLTSFDTFVYEKAGDRGNYSDEYTLIKEMAIHSGKVIILLCCSLLLIYLPLPVTFVLAAIASLFIKFLK